jgi:glycerol kinase
MADPTTGADLVLAVDQGTSSTKCLLLDGRGAIVAGSTVPLGIRYPRPGWVEQDPDEIVTSVLAAAQQCLDGVAPGRVAAIGLSTQRESALLWDTATGRPVGPMLGWQDQRSAEVCARLREAGHAEQIRELSGLPLDPMFSAAKVRWLLDTYDPDRSAARAGRLTLGTVDAWLLRALTGRTQIELGNAARTQLLDVRAAAWSPELLDMFEIPATLLPELVPSQGELGCVGSTGGRLDGIAVRAVLGDSHAALYAHGAQAAGGAKATYGTGSSVMQVVAKPEEVSPAVCLTVAWADRDPQLAAEGNIRSTGATVSWLASLLKTTPEALAEAAAYSDNGGVYLVPAFGGLAAPWWDDAAAGTIAGLTLGTRPEHLARAAIESIAHQITDVVAAMDAGTGVSHLVADGGASSNDMLMQVQADLTGVPVLRARERDLSALGAAHLAGRSVGLWTSTGPEERLHYDTFQPRMPRDAASAARSGWQTAVARARGRAI